MITKNELRKNTINSLLTTNNNAKFIVPEYQRPYVWDEEKAGKLFEDIWEFTLKQKNINTDKTYFLGSLVACTNNHNIEIIDGQQRITSIFLLLRCIYTKLSHEDKSDKTTHLMNCIAPALWKVDKKTNKPYYKKPLLQSKVLNDSGNEILKKILETGEYDKNNKDNYTLNYILYSDLYDEKIKENRHKLDDFIIMLLENTILLPIITDNEDIALTIFSTLNDRGMPLTNADKFKAEIYKRINKSDRKDFIEEWQKLEESTALIKECSMQTLFYYYMFYIRALRGDDSTSTPGLGDYFLKTNKQELLSKNLLKNLNVILEFVSVLNDRKPVKGLSWTNNIDILKSLDILYEYPNEFWKYPVIIYYIKYNKKKDFEKNFLKFLNHLITLLIVKYIEQPNVNAIKGDIVKLDVEIINNYHPGFPSITFVDDFRMKIVTPHAKLFRMLVLLTAYLEPTQKTLLDNRKWQIEHIFPQKWHKNYFPKEKDEKEIKDTIEHLGNKIPLKKIPNIEAGNNYILKKTEIYKESNIKIAYKLKDLKEWSLDHITQRDADLSKELNSTLKKYIRDYNK